MRSTVWVMVVGLSVALAGCTQGVVPDNVAQTPVASSTPTAAGTPRDWVPVDSGPRGEAQGSVTVDDDGVPVAYLVVEGDTADGVRDRFDLPWFSLAREDGVFMPRESGIFVGETLTFTLPRQDL
ncbi:MAG: hypothetical protein ACOH19_17155 [Rhodoglobus sp.]